MARCSTGNDWDATTLGWADVRVARKGSIDYQVSGFGTGSLNRASGEQARVVLNAKV